MIEKDNRFFVRSKNDFVMNAYKIVTDDEDRKTIAVVNMNESTIHVADGFTVVIPAKAVVNTNYSQ